MYNTFHFIEITAILVIEMVYAGVFWFNKPPPVDDV